ncbi:DUF1206 domain-containing protein [soil metagenome]
MNDINVNTPSASDVKDTKALGAGMRVGLVAYGAVHLLFAGIALKLVFQGSSKSSSGALHTFADNPAGAAVLWLAAAGLLLLALWQGLEAVAGYEWREEDRTRKRLESAFRVVVYLAVAWLSVSTAAGIGGSTSKSGLTAKVMEVTLGRWLVAVLGLGVVVVGVAKVVKGVQTRFTEDLDDQATAGGSGSALVRLGQVGYVAKGFALGAVGGLFVWAALSYDPKRAGGLDAALRTLLDQPFGALVVGVTGVGLAAYGVYCFGWARHPAN